MRKHRNLSGLGPRVAALAVMTGIILLAAGCGGGSSSSPDGSSSPGTSNIAKTVAYANCLREHGQDVTVNSDGSVTFNGGGGGGGHGGGATSSQSAMNACRSLATSSQQVQAHQAAALEQDLKYSQCMRSHGMPTFPDPVHKPNDGPITFPGINTGTATYKKANQACQSLLPGGGS